jgi:hypothetical protein
MKNIHVLPTDKPSKLYFNHNKEFEKYQFSKEPFVNGLTNTTNQNIYITNSEVKKNGDWVLSKLNEVVKFCSLYCQNSYEKIILTTDQDLIKDGVWGIEDGFLEWLISNPTCEFVEVDKNWNYPLDKSWEYKLRIIPKEEPKQETLEEVARRLNFIGRELYTLKLGVKWQQEQDKNKYSEEEVYNIVEQAMKDYGKNQLGFFDGGVSDPIYYNLKKWFEQFKKK